jgi:hypothetical protein
MFSIFQTIPILTRAPEPIGFEGNAISAGNVQLPFALILIDIWLHFRFINI